MIYNLFFSTLSLSCIVTPNSAKNCTNYFSDLPALIIKKIFPEYMLYIYNDSDFEYMKSIIQKDYIDFSQFLYYQNKILIENSNNEFNSLIKNLTKFNDNTIINIMKNYITHFKINQNYLNGNIVLTLAVIYVLGAICLLMFTSSSRKIIIFISLILDLTFVHNLIYYRNENLFDIIKIIVYLIILLAL